MASASGVKHRVFAACLLLCFLTDIIMIGMGPMFVRMEELSVCRAYYLRHSANLVNEDGDVDELLCKITEVQAKLAHLSGWLTFFETIPGLALGYYFGSLADIKGRRFVFLLNLVPLIMSTACISGVCYWYRVFPDPRILWLSPLGYLVGGGPQMLGPMYFSMVADITLKHERSKANIFFEAAQRIFEFVIAGSGALLLEKSLYLPLCVGLPLTILILPVLYFTPETMPKSALCLDGGNVSPSIRPLLLPAIDTNPDTTPASNAPSSIRQFILSSLSRLSQLSTSIVSYLRTPGVLPIFIVYIAEVINRGMYAHILQYMSNRFNCTIAEAARLTSFVPIFKVVVLICAVPGATSYLERRGWSSQRVDAAIVTASLGATAVGSSMVGVCESWGLFMLGLFISAFGCAAPPFLRSMAADTIRDESFARLYSCIALVQTIARLMVGPLFAYSFESALRFDMLGLPFLIVACIYLIATFMFIKSMLRTGRER